MLGDLINSWNMFSPTWMVLLHVIKFPNQRKVVGENNGGCGRLKLNVVRNLFLNKIVAILLSLMIMQHQII